MSSIDWIRDRSVLFVTKKTSMKNQNKQSSKLNWFHLWRELVWQKLCSKQPIYTDKIWFLPCTQKSLLMKICAHRKAGRRKLASPLTFLLSWSLALRHQSLACHSRFALASVQKTKRYDSTLAKIALFQTIWVRQLQEHNTKMAGFCISFWTAYSCTNLGELNRKDLYEGLLD